MIYGIGVDIVKNSRFEGWCDKKILRFFTQKEFEQIVTNRINTVNTEKLASKFAVKEAFSKAIGVNLFDLSLKEIEVLSQKNSTPKIILYGKTKEIFDNLGDLSVNLSISHEKDFSVAFVILERNQNG